MGSEQNRRWSVFDGVKVIPAAPEALMAEIDTAISNLEYARATAGIERRYDARMADGAYRAGCAALAAGELDEALHSLNISLSKCPPDMTNAVAKIQSLISLTSQQIQKSPK